MRSHLTSARFWIRLRGGAERDSAARLGSFLRLVSYQHQADTGHLAEPHGMQVVQAWPSALTRTVASSAVRNNDPQWP